MGKPYSLDLRERVVAALAQLAQDRHGYSWVRRSAAPWISTGARTSPADHTVRDLGVSPQHDGVVPRISANTGSPTQA
jgi:hypothetical protein